MEDIHFDAEGQLVTGSFMDYAMPHAHDLCDIEVESNPVPTKTNPLGVKGAGEAGCVGALPAVTNAVVDALERIRRHAHRDAGDARAGLAGDARRPPRGVTAQIKPLGCVSDADGRLRRIGLCRPPLAAPQGDCHAQYRDAKTRLRARRLQSRHDDRQPLRLPHGRAGPPASASASKSYGTGAYDTDRSRRSRCNCSTLRRRFHGDGVVAIDCGANIGVHTVEWAIAMTGWGSVVAIEAQERIYYALAGNIAINNCFNAIAHARGGIVRDSGVMGIPNARLSHAFELRQPGAPAGAPTTNSSVSRSTIRTPSLSPVEDDYRSMRCQAAARRSHQDRHRGHGAGGARRARAI